MKILTINKKELNMSEQVQKLQSRVGVLTDRIATLENVVKDTQDKIQNDVKQLGDLLIEVQKAQRAR
tara:strand:+ start:115 stop:315 length:201 start_codon:yes stop_codon:yes gene_type:complete